MNRFHFVHTAELRLNAPFRDVGRVPDAILSEVCEASAGAWKALVNACVEKEVAFLVISGGIDARENVGLRGHIQFLNGLDTLAKNHIPVFIALGPDDEAVAMTLAGGGLQQTETQAIVFPTHSPAVMTVERNGGPLAYVAGQSKCTADDVDYSQVFSGVPDDAPRIGVVAAASAAVEPHICETVHKASYWALGTSESPSRRGFSPWIVEAGALQARSASSEGARGAMLVEIDDGRVIAVDHLPLDQIRYASLRITPKHSLQDRQLCHQILDELNRLRAGHSGRGLLVNIEFESDGHGFAVDSPDLDHVLSGLRRHTATWDPFVWCNEIKVLPTAIEDQSASAPLALSVLQEARALPTNPLQRSYYFTQRFEPLMRRWTSELQSGDADRLLANATQLALHQVRDGKVA